MDVQSRADRQVAERFRHHVREDWLEALRVGGAIVKPTMKPGHGVNSSDGLVERSHGDGVLNAAPCLLQSRDDNLEAVRHPVLEFAKETFICPRRMLELTDGLDQPFDQHHQNR